MSSVSAENVNYDSDPVLQTEIEGTDYRLDSGKEGTALCISRRETGSWDWEFVAEAKWDNTTIRCKSLERLTCEGISKALRDHLAD